MGYVFLGHHFVSTLNFFVGSVGIVGFCLILLEMGEMREMWGCKIVGGI